ncbi:uncharacterized protein BDZ83DRAFT_647113 [Colletotrichum acutatum]|uniref:Replication factor A protein 3 n=1 Tax=Glomerella acutata TaxID=27357 RepID=A0AAD8XN56_GLOAC|nr:uncharacterized protein BDZ83DRAFT_647113 [Colletotrichum acutatum]KAK1730349.1 hypothetical protein BDZ83DRAFT_647113 [Colletotrichum acutatum]
MAEATSTPRITAQYLDNYVGRNVMLIGKVLQLRGDSAVLDADGNVTAILNRDVHLTNGNGAQIIGKVNPDLSIKVLTSRDLGPGVDTPARPNLRLSTPESTSTSQHPQIKASSESSDRLVKAREVREIEERKLRRQRSKPGEPEVEVKEVVDDDSELLGAILDGIGRMTVGTVAMRMDDAGRWRIRRDPGEESD